MPDIAPSLETTIRSLTRTQRSVLDHYATGGDGNAFGIRTLNRLLALGLLESDKVTVGPVTWRRYFVPTHVHVAWAAVASAEFDALPEDQKAAMMGPDGGPR